jgi:hypothetical protein
VTSDKTGEDFFIKKQLLISIWHRIFENAREK